MSNTTTMRKAAFKVGDIVEYLGESLWSTERNGKEIKTRFKGMRVEITETKPPRKGYGFIKNDEDGEPIIDRDDDGYNVYKNPVGEGCILWPEDKKQWRLVK